MPVWANLLPGGPGLLAIVIIAWPLVRGILGVRKRIREGADQLKPVLNFLYALAATACVLINLPGLMMMGVLDFPVIYAPLVLSALVTLALAPAAALSWWKRPVAERGKKLPLPNIPLDRGPLGVMLLPTLPGGDGGDDDEGPKLARVRAGRLDFRVIGGMTLCVPVFLFMGYLWLAETVDLTVGFVLLVMIAAVFVLLSRRIYRDTFLVPKAGGDKGADFEMPKLDDDAPLLAPVRNPDIEPAPQMPARAVSQQPTQPRFGKLKTG